MPGRGARIRPVPAHFNNQVSARVAPERGSTANARRCKSTRRRELERVSEYLRGWSELRMGTRLHYMLRGNGQGKNRVVFVVGTVQYTLKSHTTIRGGQTCSEARRHWCRTVAAGRPPPPKKSYRVIGNSCGTERKWHQPVTGRTPVPSSSVDDIRNSAANIAVNPRRMGDLRVPAGITVLYQRGRWRSFRFDRHVLCGAILLWLVVTQTQSKLS